MVKKATDIKPNHRIFTSCRHCNIANRWYHYAGQLLCLPGTTYSCGGWLHGIFFPLDKLSDKHGIHETKSDVYIYIWQLGHTCTAFNVHNSIMYNRKSHMLESCLTWITFWSDFWSHFWSHFFFVAFCRHIFQLFVFAFPSTLFFTITLQSAFPNTKVSHFCLRSDGQLHFSSHFFHIFFTFFSHFFTFLRGKQRARAAPPRRPGRPRSPPAPGLPRPPRPRQAAQAAPGP